VIYVSAQRGDDANVGSLVAPFRQISKAVAQSTAGDTIVVLDSGDYALFSVNKSLTIAAECAHAEVSAPAAPYGNTAVTVNADTTDGSCPSYRGLRQRHTTQMKDVWRLMMTTT
jgi:Protein of unknown function (DUF1565)